MFKKVYAKTKDFIKNYYLDIIIIVIFAILAFFPLPYVITGTGGVDNLETRIEITNEYKSKGSINAAYVSEYKASPLMYLYAKIMKYDIDKTSEYLYDNETMTDDYNRNRILFDTSLSNSIFLAYTRAEEKIDIKSSDKYVIYKLKEADTNLKIGDKIISIDGIDVSKLESFEDLFKNKQVGDKISIKVINDNKVYDRYAYVIKYDDELLLGISLAFSYNFNVDTKYYIKSYKGLGPSGGLMTSLYIYNLLEKEDLTNGYKIAGTGTINLDGKVGEIGGIKYKIMGANKEKVDIFFVPKENYEEALKTVKDNNYSMKLVMVETFDEAVEYLEAMK